ncbi:MAG: MATE family efflux transporter [Methanolobus sp.]|nr:MATE family efflux transporter [Methanolobus sp.]
MIRIISDKELRTGNIWTLFRRFTFPAMAGILVAGVQAVIDGLFIGNSAGSQGLAAVTLAFPVVMFMVATGIMVGMGSSTLVALELGRSDKSRARDIVSNVFPLLLILGLAITVLGLTFCGPLVRMLGAEGFVGSLAYDYMSVIFIGTTFLLFALALEPLVVNDGKPMFAMYVITISVLMNIVLDYVLVMQMGMQTLGAGIATVISFAMIAVMLASHFFDSRAGLRVTLGSMRLEPKTVMRIIRNGLPSFAMQFSFSILMFAHNIVLLSYGSATAVAAYGILDYSFSLFYMLFEGIANGMQPIIGFNYGAGLYGRVYRTLRLAMLSSIVVGVSGLLLVLFFSEKLVNLFNPEDSVLLKMTVEAMEIFMVSLLVQGILVVNATYYQSVNKIRSALFIHLGKIFIFVLPLLFILPMLFGLTGVWVATPISDYLMFLVVMFMLSRELKILKGKRKTYAQA